MMASLQVDDSSNGLSSHSLMKFAQILYKCTLCTSLPSILTSRDTFLSHMHELHLSLSKSLIKCKECEISFGTEEDLDTHMSQFHNMNPVMKEPEGCDGDDEDADGSGLLEALRESQSTDQAELYRCPHCDWTSSLEVIMQAHMRRYHDNDEAELRKPQKGSQRSSIVNDGNIDLIIAHNEEWYHCKLCDVKERAILLPSHCGSVDHQMKLQSSEGEQELLLCENPTSSGVDIQREFGQFACTMKVDGQTYYHCQLCNFKTKLLLTFKNHCKSVDHKLKQQSLSGYHLPALMPQQETQTVDCDRLKRPTISCSRRKRTLPISSHQRCLSDADKADDLSDSSDVDVDVTHDKNKRIRNDSDSSNDQIMKHKSTDNKENGNSSQSADCMSNLNDIIHRISIPNPCNSLKPEIKNLNFLPLNIESTFQKLASKWDLEPAQSDIRISQTDSDKQKALSPKCSDSFPAERLEASRVSKPGGCEQSSDGSITDNTTSKSSVSHLDYSMESMLKFLQDLERGVARCPHCDRPVKDYEDYCSHVSEVHGFLDMNSPKETLQESFKMRRIREELAGVICECHNGVVGRDELLQTVSPKIDVDLSELMTWGPACNKAVRDLFPDSVAQRKGKYKNYFFGVKFMVAPLIVKNDMEEEPLTGLSPLRDISKDTEEILKYLHRIMLWTGRSGDFITRDIVLEILATLISDPDVPNWGIQCNRAVRQTFPHVAIKRKWKFKTCYYGLQLKGKYKDEYCHFKSKSYPTGTPPNIGHLGSGPPVVNVLDMSPSVTLPNTLMDRQMMSGPNESNMYSLLEAAGKFAVEQVFKGQRSDGNMCGAPWGKSEEPAEGSDEDATSLPLKDVKIEAESDEEEGDPVLDSPLTMGEGLEKLVLLHPGPFIMARILNRRYQHRIPYVDVVIRVINSLQDHGLGWVCTHRPGNSKVFYKVPPTENVQEKLSRFGIRIEEYKKRFAERDPKLEDHMHERVKQQYPQLACLAEFYPY